MKSLAIVLFWWGLWSTAVALDDSAAVVPLVQGQAAADTYAYFLEDKDGNLSFEEIQSTPWQSAFRHSQEHPNFNRGITSAVYWVKLVVTNPPHGRNSQINEPHASDADLLLEIPYAPLDDLRFFQHTDDGLDITYQAGDIKPFDKRPIKHFTPVFPIKTATGETSTVYLRVTSSGTLRIPLMLWEDTAFFDHSKTQLLIFGLYFGIMLLMIMYNLLFFAWLRDINFLNYIFYICALSVFQAAYLGLGFQYLWRPLPWFNQYAIIIMIFLVDVFATLFARELLNLKKTMPRVDRYTKGILVFLVLGAFGCFVFPYAAMLFVGTTTSIIEAIALLVISSMNAYKGQRSAKLFLTAWTAFLSGAVILGGVTLGVIPANTLTSNAMLLGSTLEVILLAIMLADRVHMMEKDKTRTEKKAKIALQAVNRALLESNRVKDEFLATISHEMRTPMNGVINCLTQARDEEDNRQREGFIDNAEDAAQHLMNLIESVLSYTELQTHEFKINRESFSLPKLLEPISETYDRTAQQKGIRFRIKVYPDVPVSLWGDRRRLQQILVNLVDNAVKFTSHGITSLTVSVDSLDTEHHRVQLAFSITDTGIGIPPDMENVVFDRFKQLSGNHNRRHGGLGIGLAVCKQMAALMGADLRYRSTVGEGSEFVLAINLEYADTPTTCSNDALDIHALSAGRKALIVEDNPVNQLVLKAALSKLGFAVVCANDGAEGVRAVENNDIDIILMDCQMPVMDGFEATRIIRAFTNEKARTPIIAITANAMSRDKDACISCGMNDYMSKPVNGKLLEEVLMKWLPPLEKVHPHNSSQHAHTG